MKRVMINALLAFALMLFQTGFSSAFGVLSVCQFGILASVASASLAFPAMPAAVSALALALAFDLWVSGPPFLYALLFVLTHLALTAVISGMRAQRPLFVIAHAALGSALFDFLQCVAYSLCYDEASYWNMLPRAAGIDAILTALFAVPYMQALIALDRIIAKRRAGRLL